MLFEECRQAHQQADQNNLPPRQLPGILVVDEQSEQDAKRQQGVEIEHDIAVDGLPPHPEARRNDTCQGLAADLLCRT